MIDLLIFKIDSTWVTVYMCIERETKMTNLKQLAALFEHFHEAVYIVDQNRKILYFNIMATEISGYSPDEMVGIFCYSNKLNHVDDFGNNLCHNGCPLVESITHHVVTDHFVYLHHKNGHRIRVHVRAIPYKENDQIVGAVEVFTDETQRNLIQEELDVQKTLSLIDPLTGLFNRRFLNERFMSIYSSYSQNELLGILMIDIDHFKKVNDTHGHVVGDEILKTVSNTIRYNLRNNDYVIRMGGEEITVLLKDVNTQSLKGVSEKLRVLIEKSVTRYKNKDISVTVTIGGTLHESTQNLIESIERADEALYIGKSSGRNQSVTL